MLESAICYAKKEPIECLAAALGIIGGCFYSLQCVHVVRRQPHVGGFRS